MRNIALLIDLAALAMIAAIAVLVWLIFNHAKWLG